MIAKILPSFLLVWFILKDVHWAVAFFQMFWCSSTFQVNLRATCDRFAKIPSSLLLRTLNLFFFPPLFISLSFSYYFSFLLWSPIVLPPPNQISVSKTSLNEVQFLHPGLIFLPFTSHLFHHTILTDVFPLSFPVTHLPKCVHPLLWFCRLLHLITHSSDVPLSLLVPPPPGVLLSLCLPAVFLHLITYLVSS